MNKRLTFAVLWLIPLLWLGSQTWQAGFSTVDPKGKRSLPLRWPVTSPVDTQSDGHSAIDSQRLRIEPTPYLALPALRETPPAIGQTVAQAPPTPATATSSTQLWHDWENLLQRSELQQLPILGAMLADSLRKTPDPAVYQNMADLLQQPDVTLANKALLLDLLAEIATVESLDQLLSLAESIGDSSLYVLVVQAIARIGDNRWDGRFHEELSPALEAAWTDSNASDQALLAAIGKALAEIGAPQGINQLLLTLSGQTKKNEKEQTSRIKQQLAFNNLTQVSNPAAIDILNQQLTQAALGSPAFEVSGEALSNIGTAEAARKIVEWAQDAPADAARNLADWLSKIDDPQAIESVAAAAEQAFRSTAIEAVIDDFSITSSTADQATTVAK